MATVHENLSPFISKPKELPVYFGEGFSVPILSNYQPEWHKNLIHIIPTPGGQHIVYVGKFGLQGGGISYSNTISNTKITPDYEISTCVSRKGICNKVKQQGYKYFHCGDSFSSCNEKQFDERA